MTVDSWGPQSEFVGNSVGRVSLVEFGRLYSAGLFWEEGGEGCCKRGTDELKQDFGGGSGRQVSSRGLGVVGKGCALCD